MVEVMSLSAVKPTTTKMSDVPRYTILLVDDSDVVRATYRHFLHSVCPGSPCPIHTYTVVEAPCGKDALAYCQQSMPDVVLLDDILPDMNGLQVLQALKQQQEQEQLPVIIIAEQGKTATAVAVFKNGAMDYLEKAQVGIESLHRAVTDVLEKMQLVQNLKQQQQRQQLLTSTALKIRQCLTLEDILQTTTHEIRQNLACDRVLIYQFSSDWSGKVVMESVAEGWAPILGEIIRLEQEWVSQYYQGKITDHCDLSFPDINPCYADLMAQFQVQANLIAPILQDQHLWGLLIVHECKSPRSWNPSDGDFLFQMATQVSIAIQQAMLISHLQMELQERKRTESALRESEEKLRLLIRYAPASIAMFDTQMCYVSASQRWIDDYRLEPIENLTGRSHYEIFPEISERWRQIHQSCLAGASDQCNDDTFIRSNGTLQWISWEIHPWYTLEDIVGGIIIFSEDGTRRKQVQLEVEKFKFLVESASDMVALLNSKCEFQYANSAFCQAVGYSLPELLTLNVCSLYVDGTLEKFQTFLQAAQQKQFTVEIQHRTKSGQIFDAEVSLTSFTFADQTYLCTFARDITVRKQLESQLTKTAERFQLTMELAQIGTWDWHLSTNTVTWNETHYRLLGLNPHSILADYSTWRARVHPDDIEQVSNLLTTAISSGNFYQSEHRVIHPDGTVRWLLGMGHVLENEKNGQPERMLGILMDISARKQAEIALQQLNVDLEKRITERTAELIHINNCLRQALLIRTQTQKALQESEDRFRSAFDNAAIGMALVALDGKFLRVNPALCQFLGYTQAELIQIKFQSITHPDDLDTDLKFRCQVLNNEIQNCHLEKRYFHKNGQIVWVLLNVSLVRDEQGRPLYFVSQIQDISDRKQSETVLYESNRRWRSLLDNVQLAVIEFDRYGNIKYANPFLLQLTDYTAQEISDKNCTELFTLGDQKEILGKNCIECFTLEDQKETLGKNCTECLILSNQKQKNRSSFQKEIEQNIYPRSQNYILSKSGEKRLISWSNTLLKDLEGNVIGLTSIGEDITERFRLERMKTEFISVVSHELRTPLTSMQAALSLLVDHIIDPATEEGQTVIQIAAEGVDRLVKLVNDILDIERLEAGKIRLEKRFCNTVELIMIAIKQMQEMAYQMGVSLDQNALSTEIYADSDRLLQVLINLLSNAIKFSAVGGTVTVNVALTNHLGIPNVLFSVQDQGRGIPADKLESIFERFHQVDASDSRQKGGTGLGLAICRNIMQQHGGEIWAESILGQGSTFYFTLPLENPNNVN